MGILVNYYWSVNGTADKSANGKNHALWFASEPLLAVPCLFAHIRWAYVCIVQCSALEYHAVLLHVWDKLPAVIMCNSGYRKYAIWLRLRDGACHANHAWAALTVSRSCWQVFVFIHWKCTQVVQNSLILIIKQTCFKRYHHNLLRHLFAFSKFEWFMSSDPKIKNFSTPFVHKL